MKIARIVMGLVLATLGISLVVAGGASAKTSHEGTKVWVCKYVQKPGKSERLKGGKNPISVSSNATVGSWFNDAQGRSFVLGVDDGGPAPDVRQCPAPDGGDPSSSPTPTVTVSVPVPGPTTTVTETVPTTETSTVTAPPVTQTTTVTNTETETVTASPVTVTASATVTLPAHTITVTETRDGKTVTKTVEQCPPGTNKHTTLPPTSTAQTGGDLTLGTLLGTALVLGGMALVFLSRKKNKAAHI